ncbi:hypothetical protein BC827DRAFT_1213362 [Russula dissimulans]|nr:hypothetical protein BC827DRAFT_1213362 [Russula dissimulans]
MVATCSSGVSVLTVTWYIEQWLALALERGRRVQGRPCTQAPQTKIVRTAKIQDQENIAPNACEEGHRHRSSSSQRIAVIWLLLPSGRARKEIKSALPNSALRQYGGPNRGPLGMKNMERQYLCVNTDQESRVVRSSEGETEELESVALGKLRIMGRWIWQMPLTVSGAIIIFVYS